MKKQRTNLTIAAALLVSAFLSLPARAAEVIWFDTSGNTVSCPSNSNHIYIPSGQQAGVSIDSMTWTYLGGGSGIGQYYLEVLDYDTQQTITSSDTGSVDLTYTGNTITKTFTFSAPFTSSATVKYWVRSVYVSGDAGRTDCRTENTDVYLGVAKQSGPPPLDTDATITNPTAGQNIEQGVMNATGGNPYYFRALSNVTVADHAGLYSTLSEFEIYAEDGQTLLCRVPSVSVSAMPTQQNVYVYGVDASWFVTGVKEDGVTPCANFALSSGVDYSGSYTVRARFKFPDETWGAWSDNVTFHVVPDGYIVPLECGDSTLFSLCWARQIVTVLFTPSRTALSALFETIAGFGARWPFSWFTETYNAFSSFWTQTGASFGTADGGDPLAGSPPNFAWFAQGIKSFYGDWGAVSAAFFIWIMVLISVTSSAAAVLGIPLDQIEPPADILDFSDTAED